MRTIGLLGGMSWESTVDYYRYINQEVKRRLGGTHSAKIVLNSVDFHQIEELQHQDNWPELGRIMVEEAKKLETAGADCLVICTNTMHKLVPEIEDELTIPIIHIADATAEAIREENLYQIGLLGTKFTMTQDFYKGRLVNKFGLQVSIPTGSDLASVHDIIYDELVLGEIKDSSRRTYQNIIEKLVDQGSQGIILGCTEIGLLIKQEHSPVPVFDTTRIHAFAAVDYALS